MGIDLDVDTTEWFFIEDPFFGYHESVRSSDGTNARSCRNVRLSLATATIASQNRPIACILVSDKTTLEDDCTHAINLDEQHATALTPIIRVVARLWGFKLPTTTMPVVMTYAKQGTRVATACWNKIFVWPLLPKVLSGKVPYLGVYKKIYDGNLKCSLVELKPIVLNAEAVVHKMTFTENQDELVTITDKGLQIWNLGPSATGRRSDRSLSDEERGAVTQNERQGIRTADQSWHSYSPGDHPAVSPSLDRRWNSFALENIQLPSPLSAEDLLGMWFD